MGFVAVGMALAGGSAGAQGTNRFEGDIRAFEARDLREAPPERPVLFVGSSSFRMWRGLETAFPGFPVINRGFGGSQMSDVLHFFDRVVTRYRPALIFVYEGDNDLAAGKTVDAVFEGWRQFVERVEAAMPGTAIRFVAVKPSPSRIRWLEAQRVLNERIREDCAERPHLGYVDVFTPMLDDEGRPRGELFLDDDLHVNDAGYALWASLIGPELEAWAEGRDGEGE